ncbi:hypothetical protein C943_02202 [Mariniradius saccharolyticus AK6]|uniref:Uncharacterized protein n=1 Tax=Mariniradius saccharolyticus AK6 TaxID=1239962 RepID=M7XSP4_9BACT|nr:hypothetical protein C943_02202 [Mariniradius saccharolyticus AK6]
MFNWFILVIVTIPNEPSTRNQMAVWSGFFSKSPLPLINLDVS